MSLREKLRELDGDPGRELYDRFGILSNPFPASHRTAGNPRSPSGQDEEAEDRVVTFFRDDTSQVVVIEGTQGVGKTNFLNHFEVEVRTALEDREGYYVVRYLADPEETFDGTTRRVIEELGKEHLDDLVSELKADQSHIEEARSRDMRAALRSIVRSDDQETKQLMMEWLLGLRLLKLHREALGVQFRMDTVESKTAALMDLARVSGEAGVLKGIFLLLDEIEKQDGVLGIRSVMRYLSALRAMIDALPRRLFLMIAVTPDALRRYSESYPALRSRLQDRLELKSLTSPKAARALARFYLDKAREVASKEMGVVDRGRPNILRDKEVTECFVALEQQAQRDARDGVMQREFLHQLHQRAEAKLK